MNIYELERVESGTTSSITHKCYCGEHFSRALHIHPEMELVLIEQGEGLCIAADSSTPYSAGDMFLFHANLPHYFKRDEEYHAEHLDEECRSTYIQFVEGILPADYLTMPGCERIKELLRLGCRGIKICGEGSHTEAALLRQMGEVEGFARLNILYILLDRLGSIAQRHEQIASESYTLARNSSEMNYYKIIEYINLNYREQITLDVIANNVKMNPSAMCRYFKSKAGISIFSYLLEVRMALIKERLATTDEPVSQLVYDCGFNSIPNFNAHFRRLYGTTPTLYRNRMRTTNNH